MSSKKGFVFKSLSGKRQLRSLTKFIENEKKIEEKENNNFLIQCSNDIDYETVVSFCKEISSLVSKKDFVFEQNLRAGQFSTLMNEHPDYLFGEDSFVRLNIVFIANHSEYLNIVFNDKFEEILLNINQNRGYLLFIAPDNFNPFYIGEPSFIQDTGEGVEDLPFLSDNLIYIHTTVFSDSRKRVDLRDTISVDMGTAFYDFAFKGLSPFQRWELVKVLNFDKKTIDELILSGTLDKIDSKKMNVDSFNIEEEFTKERKIWNPFSWIFSLFTGFFSMIKNGMNRLIAYSGTIF